jgi:hypothetical protein
VVLSTYAGWGVNGTNIKFTLGGEDGTASVAGLALPPPRSAEPSLGASSGSAGDGEDGVTTELIVGLVRAAAPLNGWALWRLGGG